MKETLINQIIVPILVAVIGATLEVARRNVNAYMNKKADLIEKQKQQVIQKIGIDKYNQDVAMAKGIIMSVEQQAREFNWDGTIKHAKATEMISKVTGLSNDDIFNIIKATVAELNKNKLKAVNISIPNVTNTISQ